MTDERNETLSDTAAKFSEKYSKSHKWNYVLGICFTLITMGTGIILFYKVADTRRVCDRIYNVEKIDYITEYG